MTDTDDRLTSSIATNSANTRPQAIKSVDPTSEPRLIATEDSVKHKEARSPAARSLACATSSDKALIVANASRGSFTTAASKSSSNLEANSLTLKQGERGGDCTRVPHCSATRNDHRTASHRCIGTVLPERFLRFRCRTDKWVTSTDGWPSRKKIPRVISAAPLHSS